MSLRFGIPAVSCPALCHVARDLGAGSATAFASVLQSLVGYRPKCAARLQHYIWRAKAIDPTSYRAGITGWRATDKAAEARR